MEVANDAIPFSALAALILGAQPALAQVATGCKTVAAFTNELVKIYPDAHIAGDFTAASVAVMAAKINASPPPTDYKPEEIVLYIRAGWEGTLIILVARGCIITTVRMNDRSQLAPDLVGARPFLGSPL